jgi:chemotaxis protein methyltransferase CheR
MRIDSDHIDRLLEMVLGNTGTDLTGYRRPTLSRRISERLARLGMDAEQYLDACRNNADECAELVNAVAINVSWFFRNPIVFEIIAQSLLPNLIGKNPELRVWSAGCAAGEEAYSMAILIKEQLARLQDTDVQPVIFGTDIDKNVLQKAKEAIYPRESLKDTTLGTVDAFFAETKDGFELCPEAKGIVHFSFFDLLAKQTSVPPDSVYGTFDIVLCRNVLIYFSAEHQERAAEKLYESMSEGGYLILGDSETICPSVQARLKTVDARNKIYQK